MQKHPGRWAIAGPEMSSFRKCNVIQSIEINHWIIENALDNSPDTFPTDSHRYVQI